MGCSDSKPVAADKAEDAKLAEYQANRKGSLRRQSVLDNPMDQLRKYQVEMDAVGEDGEEEETIGDSKLACDWEVEIRDGVSGSWDTSRATKYDAAANKIYIAGVGPDALKGLVSIDFHYIRLVSNNGPAEGKDAQAFDKLLHDQLESPAFTQAQAAQELQQGKKKLHITDVIEEIERVPRLNRCSIIGTGALGVVKLVQDVSTKKPLALKIMQKQRVETLQQTRNIMNERNVMKESSHPFMCRLIRTHQDQESLFMVMELVQGGELFHLLHGNGNSTQTLPAPQAKFYAACVLLVLQHLHEHGWIYRDLKPENLLIDNEGYIKMVDFGFTRKVVKGERCHTFLGTPEYMSPELVRRAGYSTSVDYWALGCLVVEMMTGFSPFVGNDTTAIFTGVLKRQPKYNKAIKSDPECVAVLDGLLHKEERQRLGTGATGANEIRDTAWFKDCEWANMLEKTAKVPWVPKIKNKTDLSHFDLYDASDEQCLPYYGLCPWSKDF